MLPDVRLKFEHFARRRSGAAKECTAAVLLNVLHELAHSKLFQTCGAHHRDS
jgi:hypothetical protein